MNDETDELRENPGYQLWLVTNAWQRAIRRALHPLDLTHVQFAVLASVERLQAMETVVTQSDICRTGFIDPNMASDVVKALKSRGLLARLPHPTDRRAHRLELTLKGVRTMEGARAAMVPVKSAFFAPLGEDAKRLATILEKLVQAFEGCGSKTPNSFR